MSCEVLIYVIIVQSTFATYWTTKQKFTNSLVQFGLVDLQTLKPILNGPMVHFPYTKAPSPPRKPSEGSPHGGRTEADNP
jgi:hypothetical protein